MTNIEFKLYVDDVEIELRRPHSDFPRAMFDTNTREGDDVVLLPYNFLDNEDREYKGEVEYYHNTSLRVNEIVKTFIKRGNSNVDTIIIYKLTVLDVGL